MKRVGRVATEGPHLFQSKAIHVVKEKIAVYWKAQRRPGLGRKADTQVRT